MYKVFFVLHMFSVSIFELQVCYWVFNMSVDCFYIQHSFPDLKNLIKSSNNKQQSEEQSNINTCMLGKQLLIMYTVMKSQIYMYSSAKGFWLDTPQC